MNGRLYCVGESPAKIAEIVNTPSELDTVRNRATSWFGRPSSAPGRQRIVVELPGVQDTEAQAYRVNCQPEFRRRLSRCYPRTAEEFEFREGNRPPA